MHVRRVRIGELVEFFDGKNNSYLSEIISLDKRSAKLKIIKKNQDTPISPIEVSLAIALIANDKMDLIIGKAVELGVRRIIPVYSEYSGRVIDERSANKLTHWQNIIISSCEQCGQNILPTIALPIPLNSLYENLKYDLKIIMNVPSHNTSGNQLPQIKRDDINTVIMLVGPEGGFTPAEAKGANLHNYQSLGLGTLIMRAETAAIAGLSILNLHLGIWNYSVNPIINKETS